MLRKTVWHFHNIHFNVIYYFPKNVGEKKNVRRRGLKSFGNLDCKLPFLKCQVVMQRLQPEQSNSVLSEATKEAGCIWAAFFSDSFSNENWLTPLTLR